MASNDQGLDLVDTGPTGIKSDDGKSQTRNTRSKSTTQKKRPRTDASNNHDEHSRSHDTCHNNIYNNDTNDSCQLQHAQEPAAPQSSSLRAQADNKDVAHTPDSGAGTAVQQWQEAEEARLKKRVRSIECNLKSLADVGAPNSQDLSTLGDTPCLSPFVTPSVVPHMAPGYNALIRCLQAVSDANTTQTMTTHDLFAALRAEGIDALADPRLEEMRSRLDVLTAGDLRLPLELTDMANALMANAKLVLDSLQGRMAVSDWDQFTAQLGEIFHSLRDEKRGHVPTYIPQLSQVDPEKLALSVCTVDGQVFNLGDFTNNFCMQSCSKPISYLIAQSLHGEKYVHEHVGREPSGRRFNEIVLKDLGDKATKTRTHVPHNPMINAGAMMCNSLIHPDKPAADRLDYVVKVYEKLTGAESGFDASVYFSECDTADRNKSLAYMMNETGAFEPNTNINKALEFYFQNCSILVKTPMVAQMAATLAKGGVNPMTGDRVFEPAHVRNCLSLMLSCGMYDYSGEWALRMGLPAKSGVAGALMIVIPDVAGICVWSPRLDAMGNSVRGVEFAKALISRFSVHQYDMVSYDSSKVDLSMQRRNQNHRVADLLFAASAGDRHVLKSILAAGLDVNAQDYDGRSALHLAACEGRYETVRYLLQHGATVSLTDRWGNTPEADARREGHEQVARCLNIAVAKQKLAEAN